jgi:hypothetical protein
MDSKEQTRLWVEGKSIHNKRILNGREIEECCPDFSCCNPELLAPKEVRELFYKARLEDNNKITDRLLGEFLSKLIATIPSKPKVHIAGLDALRRDS